MITQEQINEASDQLKQRRRDHQNAAAAMYEAADKLSELVFKHHVQRDATLPCANNGEKKAR